MKKPVVAFDVIFFLLAGLFVSPAHAGRVPKFSKDFFKAPKSARSLYRQRNAIQNLSKLDQELTSIKNISTSRELLNELSKFNLTPGLLSTLKESALPRSPEQMVKGILDSECTLKRDDVEAALEKLWRVQDRYGDHNLFTTFARQYYSRNFGAVSPHLHVLFDRVGSLRDRDLELRFIRRLQFLAQNKIVLSKAVFPDKKVFLPKKSFRVRYLSNIGKLTASNFYEGQMVLSIERSMSSNPVEDFAIRHVNNRSVVRIDQKDYPVYGFNAPLSHIAALYTFLLRTTDSPQPITAVLDKKGQSLAIFNEDKTLWLRVSPHEYAQEDNLHIHLNELRAVSFVTTQGQQATERINFNLSLPLSTPDDVPVVSSKNFFFNQLILKPVEILKKDPNVTIQERPIY